MELRLHSHPIYLPHSRSRSTSSLSWRRCLASDCLRLTSSVHDSFPILRSSAVRCVQAPAVVNLAPGTPVRQTSILVVGATGTLGRQIVRRALDEGYDVRCLVRPRPAPADFLRDWGAIIVNADLNKPETIPATLVGIHTVIDCATGRPEEPIKTVLISSLGRESCLSYNVPKPWESRSLCSTQSTTPTSTQMFP